MEVKIQVGGSVHQALFRLDYFDGTTGAMKIRSHQWSHQKDLEKCLKYGLMEHELRGPYTITYDGLRVLAELNQIEPGNGHRSHQKPWEKSYGKHPWKYLVPYTNGPYLTMEVPGNQEWIEYFRHVGW